MEFILIIIGVVIIFCTNGKTNNSVKSKKGLSNYEKHDIFKWYNKK